MKSRVKLEQSQEDEEKLLGEQPDQPDQLDETVAEEERTVHPERALTRQEVSTRLSHLGKVAGGDGYAYLNATCTGMNLTDISELKHFQHIQFVDVSDNHLELQALQALAELPFLISLQADNNGLTSAALKPMKYLQVIIMNHNKITSVEDVYQPELCTLEVGYNKITKVNFGKTMPEIKCLDFRYNLIEDILDLYFPKLDSIFLAGNKIKSLIGLERLVNLRVLHLRYNPLKLLDGFDERHKKLEYVNLRNCKVATLRQVKKLKVLTGLETLVMKGCPYMGGTGEETGEMGQEEEDSEIRTEVLAALPRLKRLNKGIVTPEERSQAKDLITQWIEEGENDEEEIENEQHEEDFNLDE